MIDITPLPKNRGRPPKPKAEKVVKIRVRKPKPELAPKRVKGEPKIAKPAGSLVIAEARALIAALHASGQGINGLPVPLPRT